MKISAIVAALAAVMCVGVCADETPAPTNAAPVIIETLFSDGTTNTWTQADLVAALGLMNRKFHRDVQKPDGRRAWHGRLVREEVSTNDLKKVEIYEDGTRYTFDWQPPRTVAVKSAALNSKGVPVRLAEARARRAAEKATTNTVTVTVRPMQGGEASE